MLDNETNRLFHRSQTLVFEDPDPAAGNMSAESPADINDDSCIEYFISKLELFIDHISEDKSVYLKAHAAWCAGKTSKVCQ